MKQGKKSSELSRTSKTKKVTYNVPNARSGHVAHKTSQISTTFAEAEESAENVDEISESKAAHTASKIRWVDISRLKKESRRQEHQADQEIGQHIELLVNEQDLPNPGQMERDVRSETLLLRLHENSKKKDVQEVKDAFEVMDQKEHHEDGDWERILSNTCEENVRSH